MRSGDKTGHAGIGATGQLRLREMSAHISSASAAGRTIDLDRELPMAAYTNANANITTARTYMSTTPQNVQVVLSQTVTVASQASHSLLIGGAHCNV